MSFLQQQYPLILGENHPLLRSVSDPIDLPLSPEIKQFAHILQTLMYEYDGVGLAAPQIGRPIRMIATSQRKVKKNTHKHQADIVMINPAIIHVSDELTVLEEGCLSLPGVSGTVQRPQSVTVRYVTLEGKTVTQEFHGFNAAIVQHEIDHLDGVMFTDKIMKE